MPCRRCSQQVDHPSLSCTQVLVDLLAVLVVVDALYAPCLSNLLLQVIKDPADPLSKLYKQLSHAAVPCAAHQPQHRASSQEYTGGSKTHCCCQPASHSQLWQRVTYHVPHCSWRQRVCSQQGGLPCMPSFANMAPQPGLAAGMQQARPLGVCLEDGLDGLAEQRPFAVVALKAKLQRRCSLGCGHLLCGTSLVCVGVVQVLAVEFRVWACLFGRLGGQRCPIQKFASSTAFRPMPAPCQHPIVMSSICFW